MADKPKKPVDQKTLDMLAKGRKIRDEKRVAAKAGTTALPSTNPPTTKPDVPATPKATRCASCWNRPCDKSGKRCAK